MAYYNRTIQTKKNYNQGRNLILRRTHPDDAEMLYKKAFSDPEFMRLFRLNSIPDNVQQLRSHLHNQQQIAPEKSGYLEMLIIHKKYGPIGIAALAEYSPLHRRAEYLIGLFNGRRYTGYGLEATLLTLDLGFNQYNLNKIEAFTYAYNSEPQDNLVRLGFKSEGIRHDHLYSRQEKAFIDLYAFGMTQKDFNNNTKLARFSQRFIGHNITQRSNLKSSETNTKLSIELPDKPIKTWASGKFKQPLKQHFLAATVSSILGVTPVFAQEFLVTESEDNGTGTTANTLSWAIRQANVTPGNDIITLQTNVALTGVMTRLIDGIPVGGDHDDGGGDVTIQTDVGIRAISGESSFRPLFIKSGRVLIKDISLKNGIAKGGSSGHGGGGAGLGGALFIYSGTVTLQNTSFTNNSAQGGDSNQPAPGRYGGGGMLGSGKGGGGGLFGTNLPGESSNGSYGGTGAYGGFGGTFNSTGQHANPGGFGGGGSLANSDSTNTFAGAGGFGGGGGAGNTSVAGYSDGGRGGFGGGGGPGRANNAFSYGGNGGFGGGGGGGTVVNSHIDPGIGGFGGGNANANAADNSGGGGAGLGGAIFIKSGRLTLTDTTFFNNTVIAGTALVNNGLASAADVFICTQNQSSECASVVTVRGTTSKDFDMGVGGSLSSNYPPAIYMYLFN